MSIMQYNGGTVLAMKGKDCVTIACDLRLGEKLTTMVKDKEKIFKISDKVYVGLPGLATDTQTVINRLRFRTNYYKLRENRDVKCSVLTTILSNLLYERRFGPYFINPVVAGIDPISGEPYIAAMDLIGAVCEPKDFVVCGTAETTLCGMCEATWQPDMDADELFEVTAQALCSGLGRDAVSGWGGVVYTITKDKVKASTVKVRMD